MLEYLVLSGSDDDDPPPVDFICGSAERPRTRAYVLQLQHLLEDVLTARTGVSILEAFLSLFNTRLVRAIAHCQGARNLSRHSQAYGRARDGVLHMGQACQPSPDPDRLRQGFAALESAVVDIDALLA